MHELAFADAARPTPVVILKLPMRVYALGHDAALLQKRNALLFSETHFNALPVPAQIAAIREAVWICAHDAGVASSLGLARYRLSRWTRQTRSLDFTDYALAIADFRNYLAAGRSLPPLPDKTAAAMANGEMENGEGTKGRALGAPLLANLINFVSTKDTDWRDAPYAFIAWLYYAELEQTGGIRIENQAELDQKHQNVADAQWSEEFAQQQEARIRNANLATPPPDLERGADILSSDSNPEGVCP